MTVKALCEKYSPKFQAVYKKITHHKDNELAGHITKVKGESLELDDFAIDFLLPTHVKVIRLLRNVRVLPVKMKNLRISWNRLKSLPNRQIINFQKPLQIMKICLPKLTALKVAYLKRIRKSASFQNSLKQKDEHQSRLLKNVTSVSLS